MHYCDMAPGHPLHGPYHDEEYGFPISDDSRLFERLTLEVFQAGLSWELMLKKREGFRQAFYEYDLKAISEMGEGEVAQLLNNPQIVRNRLKIKATIHNAGEVIRIQKQHDSFAGWLLEQPHTTREDWVRHMRKIFKFMGPEIVGEFLMSTGLLPGAHREDCPVYKQIQRQQGIGS